MVTTEKMEGVTCPNCATQVGAGVAFCPDCGWRLKEGFTHEERQRYIQELRAFTEANPENTSGRGESAIVPGEVKGWSWGAFSLTWIWGVANKVWISLLVFIPIPFFSLVWAIVLGVKGNEWAWRQKKWDSVEEFRRSQGNWDTAGIVVFVLVILLIIFVSVSSP